MVSENELKELLEVVVLCDNYSQYKNMHAKIKGSARFSALGKSPEKYPVYLAFAALGTDGMFTIIPKEYSPVTSNGKHVITMSTFKKYYEEE